MNLIKHLLISTGILLMAGCQTLTPVKKAPLQQTQINQQVISPTKPLLPIAQKPNTIKINNINLQYQVIEKTTNLTKLEEPKWLYNNYITALPSVSHQNLWNELTSHFYLTDAYYHEYHNYLPFFHRNPKYVKRISERAEPYLYYILQEVKKRHMPYEIALLPMVESGFSPYAKSYVSAAGLWQFMPGTGAMLGLKRNWWYDARQDIYKSTPAALDYLQRLYKLNHHDWLLALASYNAGYGNILKAQKKYRHKHPHSLANFWQIQKYLPSETQNYVPMLLAGSYAIKNKENFNIDLHPVKNNLFFKSIKLKKQVALCDIAKHCKISLKQINQLNPGYLKPTTPPNGAFNLLVPAKYFEHVNQTLQNNPSLFKIHWRRHKIKSGESLGGIAYHYHTSIRQIRRLNHMKNNRIRAGKTLLIPVPESYARQLAKTKKHPHSYSGKIHIHIVKANESLWLIARYYNISARKLCEWNHISIRKPLRKGQHLKIRSNLYGKHIVYHLKKGESLWTLAKRYNLTTQQIAHWNAFKEHHILQPGQPIKLWIKS